MPSGDLGELRILDKVIHNPDIECIGNLPEPAGKPELAKIKNGGKES